MTFEELEKRRLENWCQDRVHNIPDPDAAIQFINRVGICPLYKASPEFPDLFHGHTGDPTTKADAKWDSVSGEIYSWRWKIGKSDGAFYASIVGKKPTWVSWDHLPYALAALMDRRTHDELFDLGLISADAHRVASALDDADGLLSTKELRKQGGFPTGKENRKAYLHAVEELEGFFLLAKKMAEGADSDDMSHALIPTYYKSQTERALAMSREEGLRQVLRLYLRSAIYVLPEPWAKSLRLPLKIVKEVLDEMVAAGEAAIAGEMVWVKG